MDNKKTKHDHAPTKSEFIHGENMSPDDFDMKNKDNSMTHIDKPKKKQ